MVLLVLKSKNSQIFHGINDSICIFLEPTSEKHIYGDYFADSVKLWSFFSSRDHDIIG